ncbi:unnamed protein product [Phytomonas sp. Hart1]|nr:unnamed protein product [Phytomonas sp. Hart1]|eukprot:CCW70769.1 unnamed protein product [Phytomonas sp. isolate Hart1]
MLNVEYRENNQRMRVVIVGAGLSGLTLAVFLRRLNVDCIVLEQAPFLQAQYTPPFTLFANALSCFKAFDIDFCFSPGKVEPEEFFGIKDEKGRWLSRIRNRNVSLRVLGSQDAIPLTTASPANSESIVSRRIAEDRKIEMGLVPLRKTLPAYFLRESLRRNIPEIKFNARVVDLMPHEGIKGGVYVLMEDGSSEWGDVVVGADGMCSTIRKLLYPNEHIGTCSQSLGMLQIDGFVKMPHCPLGLEHPVVLWGHQRTLTVVPLHRYGDNCIAFTASLYNASRELMQFTDNMTNEEVLATSQLLMKREYSSFFGELEELLSRANLAFPTEVLEVPVMPRWYNKRAVLMGEAAHGSLPCFLNQDASLCVEDAAILATALLDVPLSRDCGFEYAFQQYESVRRDRVERYIRQSRRARRFTTTHALLRNTVLRLVPSYCINLSQKWLSGWSYSAQQLEVDPKSAMETAFR